MPGIPPFLRAQPYRSPPRLPTPAAACIRLSDGMALALQPGEVSSMKRAQEVKAVGHWDAANAIDSVTLDAHERHRRRVVLSGEGGTRFLLDLPQATALHDGDGLVLDDGGIVRIVG